jgi:hypothetical protein
LALKNGQAFFIDAGQNGAGTYYMKGYPLEEPYFTKLTVQPSNITRSSRCFVAFYTNNEPQLTVKDCECSQKNAFICQRRMDVRPSCTDGYPNAYLNSTLDILWDPRCKFHQHFTCVFFVQKSFWQPFLVMFWLWQKIHMKNVSM